ncbi:alpha-2,8-sialyltransferase 8B-like [Branchiostoma lanceolatum]|uniref:alpha-2,8-sialyltransferase 8B-like n=1 Tax=Branchiostoma lanceolatum TaxID=7740 RepID=UPI003452490D
MAETEVVSWRQNDKDVSTETSRGLIKFIVCTIVFTAVYFLQAQLWRGSFRAMPHVPLNLPWNTTALRTQPAETLPRPAQASLVSRITGAATPHRPTLHFGPMAPEAAWQYRPEALAKVRNASMKLHPSVHLMKRKLAVQDKTVRCKEKVPNVHCRTDHSTSIGHYNTCAVVGNSGILLGSRCGAEIDSKDYVIRIDIPVVRGYEKDVGRRTSMTIFNLNTPKRLQKSSRFKNRTQDVYESRLRDIGGTTLVTDKKARHKITSVSRKFHLPFSLYTVKGSLRRGTSPLASRLAGRKMGASLTTGLVTVLMMTTFCDHPYLYGFFPFQKDANNIPIPYHYYPGDYIKPIEQNAGGHHHMTREYNFIRNLHMQGVLKLQVGPCEGK